MIEVKWMSIMMERSLDSEVVDPDLGLEDGRQLEVGDKKPPQ
jgi:hypothetical protein